MKIKLKSEKGAITLVVLIGMLFLTAFLMSMYIGIANRAQSSAETTKQIQEQYNNLNQANSIYDSYFADSDIIPIYTKEQLTKIGSEEQVVINGKVYTFSKDGYYTIHNNLNLGGVYNESTGTWSGTQWTPLTDEFTGTLDGLGHTITGLYINNSEDNQGLFGVLNGTVKNLRIVDGYLNANSYVGAIAGWNGPTNGDGTKGFIENCYSEIEIVCNNMLAGGICGLNNNVVRESYNKSNMSGNCIGMGGIAGQTNSLGTITNCYNIGSIKSNNVYVGGISGISNGTISNSYNIGDIMGNNNVGGILGTGRGNVNSCYNKGTVEGTSQVGGICGRAMNIKISNSYNIGEIIGNTNVGKILGESSNTSAIIQYCYYLGTDEDIAFGSNSGTVIECFPKNETELKNVETTNTNNIINLLNVNLEIPVWVVDTENKNGGYPILSWQ